MTVVVLGARSLMIDQGVSDAARLVLLIPLGIAVYVPLCAWRAPEVVDELRALRRLVRATGARRRSGRDRALAARDGLHRHPLLAVPGERRARPSSRDDLRLEAEQRARLRRVGDAVPDVLVVAGHSS